jgi:hypothetical protein
MRIDQFSLKIKLELVTKLNIFSTKSDGEILTLLDELSGKKWIKNWINVLTEGFDHENITVGNSHLDFLKPVLLGKLNDNHFTSFFSFNPFLTLELWIDQEWVSVARDNDRGVLKRDSISWESLCLPDSLIGTVSKNIEWVNSNSLWNLSLN